MPALPESVNQPLTAFIAAAQTALGDHLHSVALFGSAAENRMRATSDVNLILVLAEFVQSEIERLAPDLRLARAAIRLEPMFLLEREIPAAVECFAQKFADIQRRRLVLYGPDPFASIRIPRPAEIFRLRQVLLNLTMRLRESFAERTGKDDQIALLLAENAGPLRAAAATLLELETGKAFPPKEALDQIAQSKPEWAAAAERISAIREQRSQASTPIACDVFAFLEMGDALRHRAESLK